MVIPDTLHGSSPALSPAKSIELPRDNSSSKAKRRCDQHEDDNTSLRLHINHRSSLATIVSTGSDIPELGIDFSSSSRRASQHQTIGLRTKKYIIPRLLSRRKLALSVLHPSSAAVMNDIHYLLKVSWAPCVLFCTGSLSKVFPSIEYILAHIFIYGNYLTCCYRLLLNKYHDRNKAPITIESLNINYFLKD